MPEKFNQYWTIRQGKFEEYSKFVTNRYIPGMNRLGIHIVAGWSVLVGTIAEIILEGVTNDLESLEKALKSQEYQKLNDRLYNYVKDYKTKVLVPTGRKDSYSRDMKENTVKFNQAWDIRLEKKQEYEAFTSKVFYPGMEELGITVAAEWEVFIGEGPRIICEGRTQNMEQLIPNLQTKMFRDMRCELRDLIRNYESRLLAFHIQKILGYKSASYELFC